MANEHSASCIGYICTCDNCYRCEGIIKDLRAENTRYREALDFIAGGMISAASIKHDYIDQAYQEIAREALKDSKNNKEEE